MTPAKFWFTLNWFRRPLIPVCKQIVTGICWCWSPLTYDANLVAIMKRHRIARLLTRNVADFVRYSEDVEILALIPRAVPGEERDPRRD